MVREDKSMIRVRRRVSIFFFQAEDGIRDLVRSRGLGDVYKRQGHVTLGQANSGARRTLVHFSLWVLVQWLAITVGLLSLIHI